MSSVNQYAVVQSGTGLTLTPVAVIYQNNRVTDTAGLGVTYAATAKIAATALLRYSRQRLVADIEITGIDAGRRRFEDRLAGTELCDHACLERFMQHRL